MYERLFYHPFVANIHCNTASQKQQQSINPTNHATAHHQPGDVVDAYLLLFNCFFCRSIYRPTQLSSDRCST